MMGAEPLTLDLSWSRSFLLVDAGQTVAAVLPQVYRSGEDYVVVERQDGGYFYAYRYKEIVAALHAADPKVPLGTALNLHEEDASRPLGTEQSIPPERPTGGPPPRYRFVRLGQNGRPEEIGERPRRAAAAGPNSGGSPAPESGRTRNGPPAGREETATRGGFTKAMPPPPAPPPTRSAPPPTRSAPPPTRGDRPKTLSRRPSRPPEGVDITRHPSISSSGTIKVGSPLSITVDLLLENIDRETESRGVAVTGLAPDWSQVPVQVQVMSTQLSFPEGGDSGAITIRRDEASVPCTLLGVVRDEGEIEVMATFWHQGRFCGHATRLLNRSPTATATATASATASAPTPVPETRGSVSVPADAQSPDLTVTIFHPERSSEGCFSWHTRPRETFDGLPGRMQDEIDLGQRPDEYARSLFNQCAELVPGKHMDALEGLGETLWLRAPEFFKSVYWAMRKKYGPSFSIQFITDDPYIPWELMLPHREGEAVDILAASHPVARWIADYEGNLRNRLPSGRIVTIAPNYQDGITPLPGAQLESADLELAYGASRVIGTTADVLRVLQQGLEGQNVAVVHFAGHGQFGIDFADRSRILLEDGALTVPEVSNQRVKLGEKCGTLVIFNACEIGATGAVLGMVGGWAEAFSRRKFSGFLAPLWAVIDEDASKVISELLDAVWAQRKPMGAALRDIRATYGKDSPTFFSYLFYGDVMARIRDN